jgi:putative acetyltransferase
VIVRPQRSEDYEAARYIYTEAFRRPEKRDPVPLEVPLFEALWEAGDALPGFSFTAQTESGAVGHVTASKATVATDSVVAVGPIGVLPEHQGRGIGSALMDALLTAADVAHVPLIVLLGSPQYYSRFGFPSRRATGGDTSRRRMGRCLPSSTSDRLHIPRRRPVSVRPGLLGLGASEDPSGTLAQAKGAR